jgi:putative MFS transporter
MMSTEAVPHGLVADPQASRTMWKSVVLISIGGVFSFYELFSTPYVIPGLTRAGILTSTSVGFFGLNGIASYIGATFAGMFVGALLLGFISDRIGRRAVFTYSLLWYALCAAMTAAQSDTRGLIIWRFLTGIGLAVELVTADAYLGEVVTKAVRGRAFALNQFICYLAVPTVAFFAWLVVPTAPLGLDGWRWVMLGGAFSAIPIWAIRRGLPESPRWLADRAGQVKPPGSSPERGGFAELWSRKLIVRTIMLVIFNATQAIGIYGFSNWVPTFLIKNGITLTTSLYYSLGIACVFPLGPLLSLIFADRIERKWQIVGSAAVIAVAGLCFAAARDGVLVVLCGSIVTIFSTILGQAFHAYQAELYPTRIRALAIGFVYAISRVSGVFSGFIVASALETGGVTGALTVIASSMLVLMVAIGALGPSTKGRALEEIAA